jgi:putative PIN family toxin of toxin-antitoxin system
MGMTNRIIIDTNVLISFLLLSDSQANLAVRKALRNSKILVSGDTLTELATVLARPKFNSYISLEDRQEFLRKYIRITETVVITKRIQHCRDPKDDMYLELAVNGNAKLIISGDKDLLSLHPFGEVRIISPTGFLGEGNRQDLQDLQD